MEYNSVEQLIVPDTPRVSDMEKQMVYIPMATHSTEGIAKYNVTDFKIVKNTIFLRYDLTKIVKDFSVNVVTGEGTVSYSDGTSSTFVFPTTNNDILKTGLVTIVSFVKDSFVSNDDGTHHLLLANDKTGQTSSEFIAQVEELQDQDYATIVVDVTKKADGSLLMSTTEPFDGRVIIIDSIYLSKLKDIELEKFDSKYDKTGGVISGEVDITGALTVRGSTLNSVKFTDHINYISSNGDTYVLSWPKYTGTLITEQRVNQIFNGANKALGYDNYSRMIRALQGIFPTAISYPNYSVGQNIFIVTLNVPDVWISEVTDNPVWYQYTTDAAFVNTLKSQGYVQVGHFKLSALETQKVDLTNYVSYDAITPLLDNKQDAIGMVGFDRYV